MAKIRHTKGELRRQKEALKRYNRYLPTLQLKKQQLQVEVNSIQRCLDKEIEKTEELKREIYGWVAVFGEDAGIGKLVGLEKVVTEKGNIAGTDIPVFRGIEFREEEYDLITAPLWVDSGIDAVKEMTTLNVRSRIFRRQLELVREELRTTTQRVNLFEKVMIPRARENIRKIRIFLGDLQTAAVVTGKIAKAKIHGK